MNRDLSHRREHRFGRVRIGVSNIVVLSGAEARRERDVVCLRHGGDLRALLEQGNKDGDIDRILSYESGQRAGPKRGMVGDSAGGVLARDIALRTSRG